MSRPPTELCFHQAIRKIVAKWKAENAVNSSHRLHWLEGIADRIVVMHSGSVEREITSSNSTRQQLPKLGALGAPTLQLLQLNSAAHGRKNEL